MIIINFPNKLGFFKLKGFGWFNLVVTTRKRIEKGSIQIDMLEVVREANRQQKQWGDLEVYYD